MTSLFVVLVACIAHEMWPGIRESARCRRGGCRECMLLIPCDEALKHLMQPLPKAEQL
jgi:hypothetical protein